MTGKKDDSSKPRYDRLSFQALGEFNRVHEFGDSKYEEGNWRLGLDVTRLANAAIRHLTKLLDGQVVDEETGINHAAHAGVNCEMLVHYYIHAEEYKDYLVLPKRPRSKKK